MSKALPKKLVKKDEEVTVPCLPDYLIQRLPKNYKVVRTTVQRVHRSRWSETVDVEVRIVYQTKQNGKWVENWETFWIDQNAVVRNAGKLYELEQQLTK